MWRSLRAFTLVELIVVITIIGILSTVWFVSYSNYLTWARDSNRYSQLTKLSDSLQVYATNKSLPLPDDYVEITASWATNVIAYQWYVGTDVLETIDYTNGGRDPKDNSYYTYYLTKDRKSLQLMALMEEAGNIASTPSLNVNKTFAVDYSSRFPKVYWKNLWVLTQGVTNTPVQEISSILSNGYIDIVNTNSSFSAIFSNEYLVTGTGVVLSFLKDWWNQDCDQLLRRNSKTKTGNYMINPDWLLSKTVFCEMEFQWGGWTECASENGVCNFNWWKEVLYWALIDTKFKILQFQNWTNCNNSVFWDPYVGFWKKCYYR